MSDTQRDIDDDEKDLVQQLADKFQLEESTNPKLEKSTASGFNQEDDMVIKAITSYKHYVTKDGKFPGDLSLPPLQNVGYDPDSEYAKRVKSKKETYYAKFMVTYKIEGFTINSKYCSIYDAYIDLMPRPEMYNGKPNSFAKEYVAIYISSMVVDTMKKLIEDAGYKLDSAGINIDKVQSLVSFNASYASEEIPRLSVHRTREVTNDDGEVVDTKRVIDTTHNMETLYSAARPNGGVIFRGFAFGEFGVSKMVPVGAPSPPLGSTLKLTFKLLGFHAFSKSQTVRAIKSKAAKSKYGV